MKERRAPFVAEQEKFSTQHKLTFFVIAIMALVTSWVLVYGSIEQRSAVVQMWIGLTLLTAGFWFATSKGSADKETQLNKLGSASIDTATAENIAATAVATEKTAANTEKKD